MSTSTKSLKVLLAMAALSIGLLGFSLAYPGSAEAWLNPGPDYRYPAAGGTWKYGFWNVAVRSYYNVNRSHGSTVRLNGRQERSICTRGGSWSVADIRAIQGPSQDDAYFYRIC